ncbi:MAG: hypothetical protein Q9227_001212 [Pyrenula ochraceoflavens]
MATWAYPPLPQDELKRREDETLEKEQQWLLKSLQDSLASLKVGLEECVELLKPQDSGSTLVLSSLRSENVKGFVTRVGVRVVKGDLTLRLSTLPPPRTLPSFPAYRFTLSPNPPPPSSSEPTASENTPPADPSIPLSQLLTLRTSINAALDTIDITRWTGNPHSAPFISSQLRLLHDHLLEALSSLRGDPTSLPPWNTDPATSSTTLPSESFSPALPPTLSLHLTIQSASLVLVIRTLAFLDPDANLSLRDRFFGPKVPSHEESSEVFEWMGRKVKVKEKVRVETGDPCLMAVAAKVGALEHEVGRWRAGLAVVMGEDAPGE